MEREQFTLFVDNSNTRTKFALALGGNLLEREIRTMPTAEIAPALLRHLLYDWKYSRVCLSSVVPDAREVLLKFFAGKSVSRVCTGLAPTLFAGYGGGKTLGEDRIANVLAVAHMASRPVVAIDMGTAVTFDVVCPGPRFMGGIIAPGLQMMADSLHGGTSLLPPLKMGGEPANRIGDNTEEAMRAGIWLAFSGMVRETLRTLAQELGTRPYAVATGGNAAALLSCIPELDTVDEHLTLRGIAKAAALSRQFFSKD